MLTYMQMTSPDLSERLERLANLTPTKRHECFNPELVQDLIIYITEHPDQSPSVMLWILALFGVNIPSTIRRIKPQ